MAWMDGCNIRELAKLDFVLDFNDMPDMNDRLLYEVYYIVFGKRARASGRNENVSDRDLYKIIHIYMSELERDQ